MKEHIMGLTKKDFRVETVRSGKHCGGQNQNSRDTAVRITHIASGAVGTCQDERSQRRNRDRAFERLVESPVFKAWMKIETAKKTGGIIEERKRPLQRRVRTYNIPDRRVTDHRTDRIFYCCDVKSILDGDLDSIM
jgi:peptide chain release factor 1